MAPKAKSAPKVVKKVEKSPSPAEDSVRRSSRQRIEFGKVDEGFVDFLLIFDKFKILRNVWKKILKKIQWKIGNFKWNIFYFSVFLKKKISGK